MEKFTFTTKMEILRSREKEKNREMLGEMFTWKLKKKQKYFKSEKIERKNPKSP